MTFPSDKWFQDMVDAAKGRQEEFTRLGFADYRLVFEVVDSADSRHFGLVLDGYDIDYAGELDDQSRSSFNGEATLTGPLDVWLEMIGNIVTNDGADGSHTLNALSIAELPMRVFSDDPMGRDKFFRYSETLQALFDGTASLAKVPG